MSNDFRDLCASWTAAKHRSASGTWQYSVSFVEGMWAGSTVVLVFVFGQARRGQLKCATAVLTLGLMITCRHWRFILGCWSTKRVWLAIDRVDIHTVIVLHNRSTCQPSANSDTSWTHSYVLRLFLQDAPSASRRQRDAAHHLRPHQAGNEDAAGPPVTLRHQLRHQGLQDGLCLQSLNPDVSVVSLF